MKIQIINKFKIQWEDNYVRMLKDEGYEVEVIRDLTPSNIDPSATARVFMWSDNNAISYLNQIDDSRNIVFMRRYEYFTDMIERMPWGKVAHVIAVNPVLAEYMQNRIKRNVHCIYNAVNIHDWTYQKRNHGNKIAVVGYICQKKNLPLALQILAALPDEYELHFAGDCQDSATYIYLLKLAEKIKRKVFFHGHVKDMDSWLENKNYLLSTAISEGCPNNVIEAMAKGIKPVIHNWPGADRIFSGASMIPYPKKDLCAGLVFNTIAEAVTQIYPESNYDSNEYRAVASTKHGLVQYHKVINLIREVTL